MRTAGAAQFSPENFMRHVPPVNVINPAIFTSLQYLNGQRSGRDLVQQRRRASIVTVHLFGEARLSLSAKRYTGEIDRWPLIESHRAGLSRLPLHKPMA